MKRRSRDARRDVEQTTSDPALKPELGYVWESPPPPSTAPTKPFWNQPDRGVVVGMTDEVMAQGWRVLDLRQEIENLGGSPVGRTRQALGEQLATLFLDKDRLSRAVAGLSQDQREAYVILLLQTNLHSYYAAPALEKRWQKLAKTTPRLPEVLHSAGLVLWTDDGNMFLPYGLFQSLPRVTLPLPTLPDADRVVPAADPHKMLSQVQQLLALLQSETSELRPKLRWKAPAYPYAQPIVCWPPVPADAEKLRANIEADRVIELRAPDPLLDADSLQAWSEALGSSPDWAEFCYHLLLTSGVVLPGSPVVVENELGHAWMSQTPGKQLYALYGIYRNVTPWAVWWSYWRSGDVRVKRSYHGYWGLNSVDEAIALAGTNLRWILLEILSFLPQDEWLDLRVIHDFLDELFPNAATHRYLMGIALTWSEGGWREFLQATLRAIVTGPLYALGFVDLSPSLERVNAIRLRGLQDVQWERISEVPLEAVGGLSPEAICVRQGAASREGGALENGVEAGTEVSVLEVQAPVPPAFASFALRWTRPSGFSRNLIRYEFDASRLHQVFEAGLDPEALADLWRSAAGFDAPQEVTDWWRSWWERYGRVRLYPPRALLETRDAFTLQEVQAALPDLQSSILGIVTPRAALLEPADVDKILEALSRQGYMPKESS